VGEETISMILEASTISATTLRVTEINFREDPRWEEFISLHTDALIYHHPNWLSALEEEYGQKCLCLGCEDSKGRLRAVLPLLYTRGFPFKLGRNATGRRLSSLPRTPLAGPLALDADAMTEILRYTVELVRSDRGLRLEIKSRMDGLAELVPGLVRVPWRLTYTTELPPSASGERWEEFCDNLRLPRECGPCKECRKLRFGNAKRQHRVNWAVNKAIKLGLQGREAETEADLASWYELYLESMRHNAVPPRPYRFFASLWSTLRPKGQMRLLLAEQNTESQKRLVGGSILLRFGQTVFYAFTGCCQRDFGLHPHDIIQLESIRDSCKSGFRWYDFGEVTEDHKSLTQFKSKWGTEAKPLYRYYFPDPVDAHQGQQPDLTLHLRRLWRLLPLKATAFLGDYIYRYM
jgi:hypothetical protein